MTTALRSAWAAPTAPTARAASGSRAVRARTRAPAARAALAACRLCRHDCGADRRTGPAGLCHAGPTARVFSAQTEVGDELELLPVFGVALSGCNLRCDFCITGESSWNARAGWRMPGPDLAARAVEAVHAGARTVMILGGEPTLYLPDLLEFLGALPDTVPVALKTNALFADPVRTLLAGLIDVWIPDFKFGNDDCAHRLAGAPDYVATVTDNLRWMASSAAGGRLLVRHLLMPGHLDCCWAPAARWLAHHLPGVAVSLRAGYWPGWHADRHPELNRSVPAADLARAESLARELGLPLAP